MSTATAGTKTVLGRDDNGRLMTPAEFDAIDAYDECYRYELINGVLIVSPMAGPGERDPNEELGHWLRNYRDEHPGIIDRTVFEEYVRTADSRRRADRVIWVGLGRTPDPKVDVPAIVIEFVSKDKRDPERDYVVKRHEYLQLGVREYWIIDRFERALTVVRPDGEQRVEENDIYTTGLLPNFELPLKDLLGLSDDWRQDAGD